MQAEYAVLQKKYRAIKQQRMEELETLMTEQQQRVMLLRSAHELAVEMVLSQEHTFLTSLA